MEVSEHLEAQNRWRSLIAKRRAKVLQVFSDSSPNAWWDTKYGPTREREDVQSISVSKTNFSSEISIGLMKTEASVVLFHRRTITYKVFEVLQAGFPQVSPMFVMSGSRTASVNPMFPLSEWSRMVTQAKEGKFQAVVEHRKEVQELQSMGLPSVLHLPPLVEIPGDLKFQGRLAQEQFQVLICAESYPHYDILNRILGLDGWTPPYRNGIHIHLVLGDGPDSNQHEYREGLVMAAQELFGSSMVSVHPWMPRRRFLKFVKENIDGVVSVSPGSSVDVEAKKLGIDVYIFTENGQIMKDLSQPQDQQVADSRRAFWRRVCEH